MKDKTFSDRVFRTCPYRDRENFLLQQPRDNDVHVWSTNLQADDHTLENRNGYLSLDERTKAFRFDSELHRRRFIMARSTLKILISSYLNCEIATIDLAYGERGKPTIRKPATKLTFNVSHSHDRALYGFAHSRAIGVDIERERKNIDVLAIAKRFFSTDEIKKITSLPEENRLQAFFSCLTRNEAYLKAIGVGISGGLKNFTVTCDPDEDVKLIKGNGVENWELLSLTPASKYTAAICVEGKDSKVQCRYFLHE